MHINYITLMLVNLSAGMFLVAWYLWRGLDGEGRDWVPGFAAVGFVLLITGMHMTLTWPVPGAYNIAFGEMAVLFAVLMLALAGAIAWGWGLVPIGVYAFLAGIAAVIVGVRIMHLGMTVQPIVGGLAFIFSGGIGVLALPLYLLRGLPWLRGLALALAVVAGIIWGLLAYLAYWSHLTEYSDYKVPNVERPAQSQT